MPEKDRLDVLLDTHPGITVHEQGDSQITISKTVLKEIPFERYYGFIYATLDYAPPTFQHPDGILTVRGTVRRNVADQRFTMVHLSPEGDYGLKAVVFDDDNLRPNYSFVDLIRMARAGLPIAQAYLEKYGLQRSELADRRVSHLHGFRQLPNVTPFLLDNRYITTTEYLNGAVDMWNPKLPLPIPQLETASATFVREVMKSKKVA